MSRREDGIKKLIKECRNVGKKTAPDFYDAGIRGISDFKKLGTEKAFFQTWKNNPTAVCIHPCYLYAIEGAITDTSNFNDIPVERREELKKFARDLKSSF